MTTDYLLKYNRNGSRSINEIYEDILWELPFIVRQPSFAPGYNVLVTDIRQGVPVGYPLMNGKKLVNDWNPQESRCPQPIPFFHKKDWTLVDTPYNDVETLLSKWIEDNGLLVTFQQPSAPEKIDLKAVAILAAQVKEMDPSYINENSSVRAIESALGQKRFPFGKYQGETVHDVLKKDVRYVRWAIGNIRGFKPTC